MAENEELEEENGRKKKKPPKEKKEKKDRKKPADGDALNEDEGEEKLGSKILLFFIALFIIVIWLAIIGLLIKMDVGGFGSSVLYPVLKNVPYVNRILPDAAQDGLEEDTQYRYGSVDAAVERIKELEVELADASAANEENEAKITELEEQIADLSTYKESQAAFELEKEKFYEEVVFSDEAPDIEEYKAYYESIDPENAEVLYKQVVEQIAEDEELDDYVATFSSMKPKEAATIFNTMTDDLGLVADILMAMDTQSRADILGKMDSDTAAKVAQIMEPNR
jgi:flagellar motility protein MotE (MotC chaperone)